MVKKIVVFMLLISIFLFIGCAAHIHTVGNGPQDATKQQARQWYLLYGLVPLNKVDTKSMAGKTSDYMIKSETSVLDVIMTIFTGYVTITSRTVTVTK